MKVTNPHTENMGNKGGKNNDKGYNNNKIPSCRYFVERHQSNQVSML